MKKIFLFVLLFAVLGFTQNAAPTLAVWLTSSGSLTKDECKFLSEIIREGAERELSGSVNVIKGKKNPADFYVESSVTKMGSKYHIVVELRKTQGTELLNSYSSRTSDVDQLTDGLESAMAGFFDAVRAALVESAPAADAVEPTPAPVAQTLNEPADMGGDGTVEDSSESAEESVGESGASSEETVQEPVQEPEPKIEIDFANVQYLDDGKGGVLKPNGTGDPGFNAYDTFVWSSVVTQGVGADGGSSGSSGKSGGLPVWVKVVPYVLGAGFIIAGVCENSQIKKERKNYENTSSPDHAKKYWNKLELLSTTRNVFYGVGAGLVGIGAIITIAF